MAGISVIGTRPEYRRQGLVRTIMTRAFAEQRERGQTLAGLWASQAAIYQRYGFLPCGLESWVRDRYSGYCATRGIARCRGQGNPSSSRSGIGLTPRGLQAVHSPAHGLSPPRQVPVVELGVGRWRKCAKQCER
ncbi:MAG: GNAT family N-acetyltransferase [Candidatus Azotimanducaceae bacterium]